MSEHDFIGYDYGLYQQHGNIPNGRKERFNRNMKIREDTDKRCIIRSKVYNHLENFQYVFEMLVTVLDTKYVAEIGWSH